jgi:hypothetical protein
MLDQAQSLMQAVSVFQLAGQAQAVRSAPRQQPRQPAPPAHAASPAPAVRATPARTPVAAGKPAARIAAEPAKPKDDHSGDWEEF